MEFSKLSSPKNVRALIQDAGAVVTIGAGTSALYTAVKPDPRIIIGKARKEIIQGIYTPREALAQARKKGISDENLILGPLSIPPDKLDELYINAKLNLNLKQVSDTSTQTGESINDMMQIQNYKSLRKADRKKIRGGGETSRAELTPSILISADPPVVPTIPERGLSATHVFLIVCVVGFLAQFGIRKGQEKNTWVKEVFESDIERCINNQKVLHNQQIILSESQLRIEEKINVILQKINTNEVEGRHL